MLTAAATRVLTVNSVNPASLVAVTVSPADNSGAGNGSTSFTRTYNQGTVVTLTAPATSQGNTFSKWQKNGVDHSVTAQTTVTMDGAHTMTAVYVTPVVTQVLTVNSVNPASLVAVTVSPADNSGAGNGSTSFTRTYNQGTVVTLTAPATSQGNNFSKWQKNGVDHSVTAQTTVTMDGAHTMTAVYVTPVVTRVLTVNSVNPASLVAVTVSPADNSGAGNGSTSFTRTYNQGTVVTLTAPATSQGNTFSKWQKNGEERGGS